MNPDATQILRRTIGRAPIVGRERELAVIDLERESALQGTPRVLLLSGEPGIGKTRLLRTACERGKEGGWTVLAGLCVDERWVPPFLPWIEALSTLSHDVPAAASARDLLHKVDAADHDPSARLVSEAQRYRVFATVLEALEHLAGQRPVTLAFDDLQWSDPASNELLRYILVHAESMPLFVVATSRDAEAKDNRALQRTLEELHRRRLLTTLAVEPLGPDDVCRQVEVLTGQPDMALARSVHRHCAGNPFFIEEVLQQLANDKRLFGEAGAAGSGPLPVPGSVTAVIRRQLERLSPDCRAVLEIAALSGQQISLRLLSEVEWVSQGPVEAALEEALANGFIRRADWHDATEPAFEFTHDLVTDVIQQAMDPVQRREAHGRIAEALVRSSPASVDHRYLAALTHHFERAGRKSEAASHAERMGDAAMRSSASAAAVEAYRFAAVSAPSGAPWRGEIWLKLGDALLASGDEQAAMAIYMDAERELSVGGILPGRARALRRIGALHARQERFDRAVAYLQAAIELLQQFPEGASDDLVMTIVELGAVQGTSLARFEDAIANGRLALRLAHEQRSRGRQVEPHAYFGLAKTLMRAGDLHRGAVALDTALPLALEAGDDDLAAEIAGAFANYHYWVGNLDASGDATRQREELARRAGDPFAMRHAGAWLANLALARGDWEDAARWLASAEGQVDRLGSPEPRAFLRVLMGLLERHRGRVDVALTHFEEAVAGFRASGPATVIWYLGLLGPSSLDVGDDARAESVANELRDLIAALPPSSLPRAPALAHLGIMAVQREDIEAARLVYPSLLAYTGQLHWVLVDRVLGMLAAILGDTDAATRHFGTATALARRSAIEPELALTLAEHGTSRIRHGEADAGRAMVLDAIERLRGLGMVTDTARYTAATSRSALTKATLPAGLTLREAEVLVLLAEGMTNRLIGERLHISEKTVSNHLTHIFTKTGLDNRSAAVAFAIRHGLAR